MNWKERNESQMEESWTSRTELLIGKEALEKLKKAKVAVYGIGGVGSFVVEGLARAGVGHLILVDNDIITSSNLNRQIHATHQTIGKRKIEVMKQRILDINPELIVDTYMAQELENGEENLMEDSFSYVIDAVDTVSTKIKLIEKANQMQIPIISCMGSGNKLDPTRFEITTIEKTSVCPLAKVMRKELRTREIKSLKVVYSKEKQIKPDETLECSCKTGCICPPGTTRKCKDRNQVPGSISFVPSVAGLIIASEVVKDIIDKKSYIDSI